MSKSWTSRLVWEARCWKIWLGRRWYWLWDSSSVSPNNCAFERDDLSSHRCAQLGYEFKMSDDSYRTSITITCGADRSWNRDSLPPCECKMTDNPQFANIQFWIYLTINVAKKNTCSDFSTNHLKFVTHLLNCLTHFPSFWLTCSVFWPPCIPDICQFWGTTALIRPVTGAQISQKWPKQAKKNFYAERALMTHISYAHFLNSFDPQTQFSDPHLRSGSLPHCSGPTCREQVNIAWLWPVKVLSLFSSYYY